MQALEKRTEMIAMCGLYCGACPKFIKEKCPGCHGNEKASWCKIRTCCFDKSISSCADCPRFNDVVACKIYHNFMAKLFGFVFNSDRAACIRKIKEIGYDRFAAEMTAKKQMSFKRG